jgi:integrase
VEYSFDTPAQEYARDVWLFLYLCNGINFADLLLMRWENIQRDFLIFFRKKTRNTRTKNVKEITAPIYEDLRKLIEKI